MLTAFVCFLSKINKLLYLYIYLRNKFNREIYFVEKDLLLNGEKTEKLVENLIPGVVIFIYIYIYIGPKAAEEQQESRRRDKSSNNPICETKGIFRVFPGESRENNQIPV